LAQVLNLTPLLDELKDLQARVKAQKLRIETLEERLEQQTKITVTSYETRRSHFNQMQNNIMQIFLKDISPETGLSHPEIQAFFSKRFPMLNSTYTPRRVAELVKQGLLFRHDDQDGTARFFLQLKPLPEETEKNEAPNF
jgi:hypothetical protein